MRTPPSPAQSLAIVLVSGGMDSCVTAAIAHQGHQLAFLHVNYGQRTEARERKAFHDIADFYRVPDSLRLEVSLKHLAQIGGSALTDPHIPVPKANLTSQEIPSSYVPFRNAHLLSIAVSWGEVLGAGKIFIGAVEEDASGYPDCREVFYQAFNRVIELGTRPETHLRIETPLIHLKKWEIVKEGLRLDAPLHLTWSCYKREDLACGECDSCAFRLRGFQMAGVEDPIPYVHRPDYRSRG